MNKLRDHDTSGWPFDAVLVANRGEIAVRVLRTVQALGLRGIVVFHAADRGTLAVQMADQAVEITGSTPVAAYLDGAQILRAAYDSGAGAIHPGYGFLSENAGFARAVAAAGLVFIGPTPEQIELMGDKVRARNFVERAGFPVAPSAIEDDEPATFNARARAVGTPLLIKPSAGGGGKGMRIVRDLTLLEAEIERARSEGLRYFGDGRLYVERYIENPRHIEVQVLGDHHGTVVQSVRARVLGAAALPEDRRGNAVAGAEPRAARPHLRNRGRHRALGRLSQCRHRRVHLLAERRVLLPGNEHAPAGRASGHRVDHRQGSGVRAVAHRRRRSARLHAGRNDRTAATRIELRIYAEDAARGYTPTTGPLLRLRPPVGEGLRWDSGVIEGGEVTAAFDPMIAKLIVHGADRAEALARADRALRDTVLLGCKTNIGFLRRLIAHPAFVAGEVHTGFLDANPQIAAEPALPAARLQALLAAAAVNTKTMRDGADAIPSFTPHSAPGETDASRFPDRG